MTDEFEKSLTKKYRASIFSRFVKALKEYKLLQENDNVLVFLDNTLNSLILAKLFKTLLKHSDFDFKIKYLTNNSDAFNNLKLLNIDYDYLEIQDDKEIYEYAKKNHLNKIVLNDSYDDVIIHTFKSILNKGSFETLKPKLYALKGHKIEYIRPLYCIREKDIINYKEDNHLNCLDNYKSNEDIKIKKLIDELAIYNDQVEKNLFKVASNVNLDMLLSYKK